ncbi:Bug family tripartite tricarboxylate transporter substrate binding protein [Caldalkalibacillus salinus]|uniref:Bug family tripartite tricarboxylate transporter substrate binding protein n=1 Tax=Caldalkalibacillus salinus TaxID=2803787 RepID=UPI00192135C4|nr:tripartite tricarboxylate transporter substrate binding protein [Caldalkalibacillus salinus]
MILFAMMLVFAAGCQSESTSNETAADFPERSIDIIVPYAPGGTTDTSARALASVASQYMPNEVEVNVINKAGGGGVVGTTEASSAKPDGYTIGMTTSGPMTIKPHTDNTAYNPDTLKPILQVVGTPNVLVVQADAPWEDYDEWFEYVSNNPEAFSYGTSGAGLTQHISMEAFTAETGAELTHVPFEGGAPALSALLGGHVEGALVQTTEALPHIQSGELRPIVNTGTFKPEELADVPLLTEKGVDVQSDVWTGLVAPEDTPDEVVQILHDVFKEVLEDEQVIETFENLGVSTSYAGPEDFYEIIKQDYDINGDVLKAAGIID